MGPWLAESSSEQKACPKHGRDRPGCIRNPRATRCSGCTPAEPYPPCRAQSMRGRADPVICKINEEHDAPANRRTRMNLLERNGDRTDPWAFGWPVLKIGLCALLWPDWKRYSVLQTGCTDSRLSQAFMPALCQRRRSRMQRISQLHKTEMRRTH